MFASLYLYNTCMRKNNPKKMALRNFGPYGQNWEVPFGCDSSSDSRSKLALWNSVLSPPWERNQQGLFFFFFFPHCHWQPNHESCVTTQVLRGYLGGTYMSFDTGAARASGFIQLATFPNTASVVTRVQRNWAKVWHVALDVTLAAHTKL